MNSDNVFSNVEEIRVVLKKSPTTFCRPSKVEGVNLCFDDSLNVTQWVYDPEVFAKAYGANISKLSDKIDNCPVCKKKAEFFKKRRDNGEQQKIVKDSLITFTYTMLEDLARKHNVPIPDVVIGKCPSQEARVNTCYMAKEDIYGLSGKRDKGKIYLHPEDIGPTSIAHEFYHYSAFQKGNPEAANEMKAIQFAKKEVNEYFPLEGTTMPLTKEQNVNKNQMIMKLSGGTKLLGNQIWDKPARILGVNSQDLDLSFTPEILATTFETMIDACTTKIGSTIVNLMLGGTFLFGAKLNRTPAKWKKFLIEMAGHHISKIIKLLNPREFSVVTNQAYDFGKSIMSFDGNNMFQQLFRTPESLANDMKTASDTINRITKISTPSPPIKKSPTRKKYSQPMPILDLGISQS